MKRSKPVVSILLAAAMTMSVASCSAFQKIDKEAVVDAAESYAKNIVSMNYKKLDKATKKINKDIQADVFEYDINGKYTDDQIAIIDTIMRSVEYTVDEETVEGDKESASVDIVFTMVDYEEIFDDEDNMTDLMTCLDALANSDETIEKTITAEFDIDEDDFIITNFKDFEKFYDFMDDIDVEFPSNYVFVESYWFAPDLDGTYTNTSYLDYELVFQDMDTYPEYVSYTYYYNAEEVFTNYYYYPDYYLCSLYLDPDYDSPCYDDGLLAAGVYSIEVFDPDGEVIAVDNVIVCRETYEYTANSASVSSAAWYNAVNGAYPEQRSYISLDVYFYEYPEESYDLTYYYYYMGDLIYSDSLVTGSDYIYCDVNTYNCFPDNEYFPVGEYTVELYDNSTGEMLVTSTINVLSE